MLLRQLSYLVALAKERHFARAAATCNITQPALSAAIRQLEEELGVMLVERDKRFNGFTPEGQEVLLWARRMLADEDSLRQGILNARRSLTNGYHPQKTCVPHQRHGRNNPFVWPSSDVNRAARVMALACGGEIITSDTTVSVCGALEGVEFVDLGEHALRGQTGETRVFGVVAHGVRAVDRARRYTR